MTPVTHRKGKLSAFLHAVRTGAIVYFGGYADMPPQEWPSVQGGVNWFAPRRKPILGKVEPREIPFVAFFNPPKRSIYESIGLALGVTPEHVCRVDAGMRKSIRVQRALAAARKGESL